MTQALSVPEREGHIALSVEKALEMLQQAQTLDEVMQIRVQAKMLLLATRELKASKESCNIAQRLVTRAELRMGALAKSIDVVPNDGSRGGGHLAVPKVGNAKQDALVDAGLTQQRVDEARQIVEIEDKRPGIVDEAIAELESEDRKPTIRNIKKRVEQKAPELRAPKKKARTKKIKCLECPSCGGVFPKDRFIPRVELVPDE